MNSDAFEKYNPKFIETFLTTTKKSYEFLITL